MCCVLLLVDCNLRCVVSSLVAVGCLLSVGWCLVCCSLFVVGWLLFVACYLLYGV